MIKLKCLDEPFKKKALFADIREDKLILKDEHGDTVTTEDMEEVIEKIQLRGMSGDTRHIVLPCDGKLLRFKQYGKAIRYLQNSVDIYIARKQPESVTKIRNNGLSQVGIGALFMAPGVAVIAIGNGGALFYGFILVGLVGVGMGLTNLRRSIKIQKMITSRKS